MSKEIKEQLRKEIAQSRRLQQQTVDRATTESIKTRIEELEARLLLEVAAGRSE